MGLIEVQGGGMLRPHLEDAVNGRQDGPSAGVLSYCLVAAEPTRGPERVECSQPLVTVPAARVGRRGMASRGNPEPCGLLLAALTRELGGDAEVNGALGLEQPERVERELGVPPGPLHLGLEV
jgi:hypothetical protein